MFIYGKAESESLPDYDRPVFCKEVEKYLDLGESTLGKDIFLRYIEDESVSDEIKNHEIWKAYYLLTPLTRNTIGDESFKIFCERFDIEDCGEHLFKVTSLQGCDHIRFSRNLKNCTYISYGSDLEHCHLCTRIQGKKYYIFNRPQSRDVVENIEDAIACKGGDLRNLTDDEISELFEKVDGCTSYRSVREYMSMIDEKLEARQLW